ncbi:MAG: polyprenyl synthetase family protein [Caldilineaceae bacterium]|nr:polyprenyl synthetase family protein [Caldilineaceae bacterium]MBP8107696.1 polyprenyl synthetase family protein [Caldilineaceae bacterium]MBP8122882.1 polyprenyl synthetase family protein [Caldilineaceae bacterium]MBP9074554.1 polyprenyl synthetase family protein [Caldilineaceae bacterium]
MQTKDILTLLENLPGLLVWPEVQRLLPDPDAPLRADWVLPLYSIRALGGDESNMLPLAAALACVQMSIILVDDILDDDPRGHHLSMGSGRAANLALALQSAAHLVIKHGNLVPARIPAIGDCLQAMAFATAVGQEMDVGIIADEEDYWQLVRAKSTPFYASAFELGAVAAGATGQQRTAINEVGMLFGEIIQLLDDLDDAFGVPAKPDWTRQNNNLVILFAKTANHPEHEEFVELLKEIHEFGKLDRAQEICIQAGSVSYCIYQIVSRIGQVKESLKQSGVLTSDPILDVFRQQLLPLKYLLHRIGVEIPSEVMDILN